MWHAARAAPDAGRDAAVREALAAAAIHMLCAAAALAASAAITCALPHGAVSLAAAAAASRAAASDGGLAVLRERLGAAASPGAALRAAVAALEDLRPSCDAADGGAWRLVAVGAGATRLQRNRHGQNNVYSTAAADGETASPRQPSEVVVTAVEVSGRTPASRARLRRILPQADAPVCRCAPAAVPAHASSLCAVLGCCAARGGDTDAASLRGWTSLRLPSPLDSAAASGGAASRPDWAAAAAPPTEGGLGAERCVSLIAPARLSVFLLFKLIPYPAGV